jgi:hypothetical protein
VALAGVDYREGVGAEKRKELLAGGKDCLDRLKLRTGLDVPKATREKEVALEVYC